ncbi:MAG: hypothetical protein ACOYB8_10725 [Eubacteriaceae bacterium]|jgi:hypothetical protein
MDNTEFAAVVIDYGELGKEDCKSVFAKVREKGTVLIQDNETDLCVLMDPVRFQSMLDLVMEYQELNRKLFNSKTLNKSSFTSKDVMEAIGYSKEKIDSIDTSIEELMMGK